MEAMWTRFLPAIVKVREWLARGTIGEVRMVVVDFGFRAQWDPEGRLLNANLAGGGLMDIGIYTLSLASMVLGRPPVRIKAMAEIGKTGVDEQAGMILSYDKGELAVLTCAVRAATPQTAVIIGTEGFIKLPAFWHASSALLQLSGKEAQELQFPLEGIGYNYEAREVGRCLRDSKKESNVIPLDESVSIIKTMDSIRAECGLRFPFE